MDVLLGTAAVGRYLAGQTIVVENAELFSKPLGILAEQVSRFPLVLVLVLVLLLLAACRRRRRRRRPIDAYFRSCRTAHARTHDSTHTAAVSPAWLWRRRSQLSFFFGVSVGLNLYATPAGEKL